MDDYDLFFPDDAPKEEPNIPFPRPTTGFIKMPKDIVLNPIWKEENLNAFKIYIYLQLFVNYTNTTYYNVQLRPGQIVTGSKELAKQTNLTRQKVRLALEILSKLNLIKIDHHGKFSIITLVSKETKSSPKISSELTENQKKFRIEDGNIICAEGYLKNGEITEDIQMSLKSFNLNPSKDTIVKLLNKALDKGKQESIRGKINKKTGKPEMYGYIFLLNYVKTSIINYHNKSKT